MSTPSFPRRILLGETLQAVRKAIGMKVPELAEKTGLDEQTIRRLEAGQATAERYLARVALLCREQGFDIGELINRSVSQALGEQTVPERRATPAPPPQPTSQKQPALQDAATAFVSQARRLRFEP